MSCLKVVSDLASYIEGKTVFIRVGMIHNSNEFLRVKLSGLHRLSVYVVRDGYNNVIILDFVHDY